ncbi:MAG: hypothetical protein ACK56I_13425, partial [bacterium]
MRCWGENSFGQLGIGNTVSPQPSYPSVNVLTDVAIVATGAHSCAVVGPFARLYCWGRNDYGALGDGTLNSTNAPPVNYVLSGVNLLAVGLWHTCAVTQASSDLYCFGSNYMGQVGSNSLGMI